MPTGSLTVPGLGAAYALRAPFGKVRLTAPQRPDHCPGLNFCSARKSAPSVSPHDFRFWANAGLGARGLCPGGLAIVLLLRPSIVPFPLATEW